MLSVIFPTYNEKENSVNLAKTIFKICKDNKIDCEIILVDDNSPDKTYEVFKKSFKENKKARAILRTKDRGLAKSIRKGIENAKGKYILLLDVDFSHEPNDIPKMFAAIKENDIVLGSRYVGNARLKSKWYRQLTTGAMELFIRIMLNIKVKDVTNGYLIIRKSLLEKLNYDKIFYGYGDYMIRLLYYAQKKKAKIKEVPSTYKYRTSGESKTKVLQMGWQYGIEVLKLRFDF